jgi:hypothetical protein
MRSTSTLIRVGLVLALALSSCERDTRFSELVIVDGNTYEHGGKMEVSSLKKFSSLYRSVSGCEGI